MTAGYLAKELAELPPETQVHVVIGSTESAWREIFTLAEAVDPTKRTHALIVASPQKTPAHA